MGVLAIGEGVTVMAKMRGRSGRELDVTCGITVSLRRAEVTSNGRAYTYLASRGSDL